MDIGGHIRNVPLPPGQIVGIVVGAVVERCIPTKLPGLRDVHVAAGLALAGAGLAITALAVRARRRRADGEFDLANPPSLVTDGPHARSRNPMYVGWWLIHLGFGIARGSAWVFVTLPLAVLAEHGTVRAEERKLAQQFGSEFDAYVIRVPRYVGWRSLGISR